MRLLCALLLSLLFLSLRFLAAQDVTGEIPDPLPPADEGDYDITNILLLGSDTTNPRNAGRTDVLLIVSVNRTAGTVAFLSIPRDLYVYIPDWQMQRINVAYAHGENDDIEGGGQRVIADTILYNLGIQIDHFARVDFNDFKTIVDNLGGVEVPVDCAIEDWRLREPDLDPTVEENWALYTLPVGVHQMDGDLALWYVRSRRTSSDLDRGRRQQDVVRALWRRIRGLGLLHQLADVWTQVTEIVDTDIELQELLDLVPLALALDSSHIASHTFRVNIEVVPYRAPDGASVLQPVREAVIALGRRFLLPPTENQLFREGARVEVVNASGVPDFDRVAAERLAVEGFVPVIAAPTDARQYETTLYDYTGRSKGSSLDMLETVLRIDDEAVIVEPDPNRVTDFRVVIGSAYRSCTYSVLSPAPPDSAEGAADS